MEQADSAHTTSRRGFLGHVAGAYLAVGAATMTAIAADPVFAAIKSHAAAHERLNGMVSVDPGWNAAIDDEGALWAAFCACRPTTYSGLAAYAAHAAAYPDLSALSGSYGPAQIIANMADALKDIAK